jgi:Rib/alpha/Esp surface antigen-like repeat protein
VGPGALVYGPGIPLGTRVFLPIPFDNEIILDTRVPPNTGLTGPFNFRGNLPTVLASPVTGKSATLRVVGTEDLFGEANWTYTWSLLDGPSGVTATFAPNKTNGAKKTVMTLSTRTSGAYLFRVKITAPDGSFITNDVNVRVP